MFPTNCHFSDFKTRGDSVKFFYDKVIKYRKFILFIFLVLSVICALCKSLVSVNYDMNSYLPDDSPSTIALDIMEEEFDGGIPNARVLIHDLSIPEALEYKEKLEAIDGVTSVTWLDDAIDLKEPLETQDIDEVETYYKDNTALFTLTINEEKNLSAVDDIRELIGDKNAMTGSAVSTAVSTTSTIKEVTTITIIAVIFVFLVLVFTTTSWLEPIVVLIGLGVSIILNGGSNLIFGEISFVSNAAGSVLQLAVSLDYSVFLIHRFEECRKEVEPKKAMHMALCKSTFSILSSGLTTVIGFAALTLMRFKIGPDLGLVLAKGVAISLLTVFLFMPGLILATYKWLDKTKHRSFLPTFRRTGKLVSKITLPLLIIVILMIVPSYLASTNNDYYYGSTHIFEKGTQFGDDTTAIEDVFGKSDTYVLLVKKGDTATETELCNKLKELPEVTSIISYVEAAGAEIPSEYLDADTLKLLQSEHYSRMVLSIDAEEEGDTAFSLVEQIRDIAEQYYPDNYYLAGAGVSTYDLMNTVTADMIKVNLISIGAVFLVLLLTMKSITLPIILVLTIETAIWINLSIPYYAGQSLFYIAYLIISSVQLGATVDYAILFTDRYQENSVTLNGKSCIIQTIMDTSASILTSGTAMTVVGFLLGMVSSHGLLSQLGYLLGKGTLCSLILVFFVLPGFLYLYENTIGKWKKNRTTKGGFINE